MKISSFTDLKVWQEGHKLVLLIYKVTDDFPSKEQFSLVLQMRRCAVSITSNIAEGFSRKGYKEKLQFYYMALGSVTELQNQLLIARDVGFINQDRFKEIAVQSVSVNKLIRGFMRSAKILNT